MKKFILLFCLLFSFSLRENAAVLAIRMPVSEVKLSTDQKIIKILSDSGFSIRMQRNILAQSKLESGDYTNRLARNHNNVFSMRHPGKRPTLSLGPYARAEKKNGYASFHSVDSSVVDFMMYMRYCHIPDTTVEGYVKILKRKGYFQDNEMKYLEGMKEWLEKDKNLFVSLESN